MRQQVVQLLVPCECVIHVVRNVIVVKGPPFRHFPCIFALHNSNTLLSFYICFCEDALE